MRKLKIILLYSIIIFTIIYCVSYINSNHGSKYNFNDKEFVGIVVKINKSKFKTTFIIKGKEKLLINYYGNIDGIILGSKIKVIGEIVKPSNNTNFNLFNYKKYLLSQKINYTVEANNIELVDNHINFFYKIKNRIIYRLNNDKYLPTFILGDTNNIDDEIKKSYRTNGISHLFAVSGLHVNFLSIILLFIFNKITKKYSKVMLFIFLIFYAFLVGFSPSIMRCILFMILLEINRRFKFYFSPFTLFIFLICLFLIYNPYLIYNAGFIYSFTISEFLIFFSKKLKGKTNFNRLLKVSILSFLASFPITIFYSFEINLISPFLNLFFVPFISFIVFPFSFITLVFPFFQGIYSFITSLLENISIFFSSIKIMNITFAKPNLTVVFLYYLLITSAINNKKNIIFLLLLIIIHFNAANISSDLALTAIDVNQGDSLLIKIPHSIGCVLIDTGGNLSSSGYLSDNIIIPYLKSIGIRKINYLILTHGDFDHMGEAINLVNNFKVEKVIFNCGEFNNLEQELIKVLNKKKIPYYSCIKELNIDNNKLYFLQTKEYDNENDNSNVIYTEINGYKFMFMGDAGVEKEKDILERYNISNIDVLKVGHHGSRTSSGEEFISEINPKYSIISVGKNNRYGHPNKEVLDTLKDSKIYRTDQDGSIMFRIKNDKLKIETCAP